MKILALSVTGKEYLYIPATAHKVNQQKAKIVCDIVNKYQYKVKPGYTWHIHEIDNYDNAFYYASAQAFTISKNGLVKEHF